MKATKEPVVEKKAKEAQEEKISQLQKQVEDITQRWKRALADYQNLEKRTREEKASFAVFAQEELLYKLLPVLDTLKLAGLHLKDQGLELAIKTFEKVLYETGVVLIEALHKEFDPHTMECVEVVRGEKDNIVVEELMRGYMMKGKVIRPARVKVSKNSISN